MMNMKEETNKLINRINAGFIESQAVDFIETLDVVKDLLGEIPKEMVEDFKDKSSTWLTLDISESTKGLINDTLSKLC